MLIDNGANVKPVRRKQERHHAFELVARQLATEVAKLPAV